MRSYSIFAAATLALAIAPAAFAQTTFNIPGPAASIALQGTAGNTIVNFNETSNYVVGNTINIASGTLTSVNPLTWASEARIRLTNSGGFAATVQPSTLGATFTTVNVGGATPTLSAISGNRNITAGSTWSLEFFESLDDGAGADSSWTNLNFSTTLFTQPTPPTSVNLGNLSTLGTSLSFTTGGFAAGEVKWYRFTAPDINNANSRFLDMFTSALSGTPDTEIGVYNSFGDLVATDDDDDDGNFSALSFGQTSPTRPANGNGAAFNGRDGSLFTGTYYLAVAEFNATFNTVGFGVTTNTTVADTAGFSVTLRNNFGSTAVAPEPATFALLALALPVAGLALRRRRNS